MSDHDFFQQVLTALGELKAEQSATTTEVRGIVARLDKLNGKVADHERRLGEMLVEVAERRHSCPLVEHVQHELAEHVNGCPMKERLDVVEDFVAGEKAAAASNRHWMARLWPVIWAGIGSVAILILQHADKILPHLPK